MKPPLISTVLAALALGATSPAMAQNDLALTQGGRPLYLGGRLGLSMATLTGEDVDDTRLRSRNGFSISGFATIRLGPNFALEPAVGYAEKGAALKADLGGATVKADYLSAPLLAVGLMPVNPQVNLRVFAGPCLSILLSAKVKQGTRTQDVKDETRPVDLGLVAGAGLDVALPGGLLIFDLRYEVGLLTVDDTSREDDIRNRVLSANGGFAF